jgi:hypothetical protein
MGLPRFGDLDAIDLHKVTLQMVQTTMVMPTKESSSFKTQIISSTDKTLNAGVSVCDPTKVGGFATASMNDNG